MIITMKRGVDVTDRPLAALRQYLKRHRWQFRMYYENRRELMDAWRACHEP